MKFAVISDIHGNIFALRAALAAIDREGVDRLLVLGDLFSGGHVHDILDELRGRDALIIRGNGEGYLLDADPAFWRRYAQFDELAAIHRALSPEHLHWIAALPAQISLAYPEFSLRMTHIEEPASETLTLCGHIHKPFVRGEQGRYVCNAGSVGLNFDPAFTTDVTFITCENGELAFDQRRVPYDFEARRRVSGDNIYTRLILRGTELGRDLWKEFLAEARQRGGWPVPNNVWHGLFAEWVERGLA